MTWWPKNLNFLPSFIIGFTRGSIYKAGSGSEELMEHIFTSYNITQTEIWSGTMICSSGKAQLFCNKDKKDSILGNVDFDFKLKNCQPHKFLSGDVNKIAKVCTASESIPVYVPSQNIDDIHYADGGTVYWSPLTPMADSINSIAKKTQLHLTYFSSSDVEAECDVKNHTNIVENTDKTFDRILKTLAVNDRLAGIDLVKKINYNEDFDILYFSGKCSKDILIKINKNIGYSQRSFLELYRKDKVEVDITNFEPKDVHKIIKETRENYNFRLWICCDPENSEHLNKVFKDFTSE